MNYKYVTSLNGDLLTVAVTLPMIEAGHLKSKVDTATVLNDLKLKYGIIGCVQKLTLISSDLTDVSGDMIFRVSIPEPPLIVKRPKNTIKSAPKKEDGE